MTVQTYTLPGTWDAADAKFGTAGSQRIADTIFRNYVTTPGSVDVPAGGEWQTNIPDSWGSLTPQQKNDQFFQWTQADPLRSSQWNASQSAPGAGVNFKLKQELGQDSIAGLDMDQIAFIAATIIAGGAVAAAAGGLGGAAAAGGGEGLGAAGTALEAGTAGNFGAVGSAAGDLGAAGTALEAGTAGNFGSIPGTEAVGGGLSNLDLLGGGGTGGGATTGGGMDWLDELFQNYNPNADSFMDPASSMPTIDANSLDELFRNYDPNSDSLSPTTSLTNSGLDPSSSMPRLNLLEKLMQNMPNTPPGLTQLLKQLSGGGTDSKQIGSVLASILGAYGANRQTNALSGLSAKYDAYGAPYRALLAQSYATPDSFLKNSPDIQASVGQGTDALARSLSVQGNPAGSGAALQQLQNYATQGLYGQLGNERNRLANFGGLSSFNAAAPGLAGQSIASQGNLYNAIGSGISSVTNPQPSLTDIIMALNGGKGLSLNTGSALG